MAVLAQEEAPGLSVELNVLEQIAEVCRLTMLAENRLGHDLDNLVLETVLITNDGLVDRLTLFDFQSLPQGRPRVRQFDLPALTCADLGQVLINGVQNCTGDGLDETACEDALRLSSRSDVELSG
ncbi:hypothetical protein E2K80_12745 [Rhodophyticola sp. CCM32]|nr:hypothetical protein E2K80_12745 [Rhodophyticola sp. CCM32]